MPVHHKPYPNPFIDQDVPEDVCKNETENEKSLKTAKQDTLGDPALAKLTEIEKLNLTDSFEVAEKASFVSSVNCVINNKLFLAPPGIGKVINIGAKNSGPGIYINPEHPEWL